MPAVWCIVCSSFIYASSVVHRVFTFHMPARGYIVCSPFICQQCGALCVHLSCPYASSVVHRVFTFHMPAVCSPSICQHGGTCVFTFHMPAVWCMCVHLSYASSVVHCVFTFHVHMPAVWCIVCLPFICLQWGASCVHLSYASSVEHRVFTFHMPAGWSNVCSPFICQQCGALCVHLSWLHLITLSAVSPRNENNINRNVHYEHGLLPKSKVPSLFLLSPDLLTKFNSRSAFRHIVVLKTGLIKHLFIYLFILYLL